MSNEDKAALRLAAIQAELISLFGDFCKRSPAEAVASLLGEFNERRLRVVFTMTTSHDGTDLFCGVLPSGAAPDDLQALFTVSQIPAHTQSRGVH